MVEVERVLLLAPLAELEDHLVCPMPCAHQLVVAHARDLDAVREAPLEALLLLAPLWRLGRECLHLVPLPPQELLHHPLLPARRAECRSLGSHLWHGEGYPPRAVTLKILFVDHPADLRERLDRLATIRRGVGLAVRAPTAVQPEVRLHKVPTVVLKRGRGHKTPAAVVRAPGGAGQPTAKCRMCPGFANGAEERVRGAPEHGAVVVVVVLIRVCRYEVLRPALPRREDELVRPSLVESKPNVLGHPRPPPKAPPHTLQIALDEPLAKTHRAEHRGRLVRDVQYAIVPHMQGRRLLGVEGVVRRQQWPLALARTSLVLARQTNWEPGALGRPEDVLQHHSATFIDAGPSGGIAYGHAHACAALSRV
mmetsp:Transcript_61940/g.195774  ORF Transcript_61940/g.195774 Transcript_61940/m.195774 type:complete len:366 (-) Transcript_61940:396-1493(-)